MINWARKRAGKEASGQGREGTASVIEQFCNFGWVGRWSVWVGVGGPAEGHKVQPPGGTAPPEARRPPAGARTTSVRHSSTAATRRSLSARQANSGSAPAQAPAPPHRAPCPAWPALPHSFLVVSPDAAPTPPLLGRMEPLRLSHHGDVAELVCEFLEVCIHQLLCIRALYPPGIFERRRHFNVPVQWARHPDLREYIHSAVTSLQPWIQHGAVEKIAVLFVDGNQVPVEKVVFKFCLKQVTGAGLPASHLEFALRGFLLKLCVSNSALAPLPPDCSWEVVAYMKSLSAYTTSKSQFWIPANDNEDSNRSLIITTIKSMRSSCLDMQLYVEHPGEEPQKKTTESPTLG